MEAVPALITAVASAGTSAMMASKQERAANEMYERQKADAEAARQQAQEEALAAEERQKQALAEERARQEAAAQREFSAATDTYNRNLENYNQLMSARSGWIDYWDRVAKNPGEMHPDYQNYKHNVMSEGMATRENLAQVLARQGIVGGKQQKLIEDTTTKINQSLTDALMRISKEALQRKQEIEAWMPAAPTKPFLKYDSAGVPQVQRSAYSYAPPPSSYGSTAGSISLGDIPDFSDLGTAIGAVFTKTDEEDANQVSSLGLTGSLTEGGTQPTLLGSSDPFSFESTLAQGFEEDPLLYPGLYGK